MECNNIIVSIMINDNHTTCNVEKIIPGKQTEFGSDIIKLKAIINEIEYISSQEFDVMEFAIIDFQKVLPKNIKIICCQTCRHGNFCRYGNDENKIFCLIDYSPKDKMDVAEIFSKWVQGKIDLQKNELFHCCEKYQKINNDYYTYNDWNYFFKEQ